MTYRQILLIVIFAAIGGFGGAYAAIFAFFYTREVVASLETPLSPELKDSMARLDQAATALEASVARERDVAQHAIRQSSRYVTGEGWYGA